MPSANSRDLTTTLVSGLKKMIADGDLHHGARLPPERDLAKRFSVNRASVRHALKALEVMGVVRQRVGDGTYLMQDASTALSAPMEFLLLVEASLFPLARWIGLAPMNRPESAPMDRSDDLRFPQWH